MQHQLVRDSATSCIAIEHCVSTSVGAMENRLYVHGVFTRTYLHIIRKKYRLIGFLLNCHHSKLYLKYLK